MKLTGWIAMEGADHEGIWPTAHAHTVYWDLDEAKRARDALKTDLADAPQVVEVVVEVPDS